MSITILLRGLYKRCACGCGYLILIVPRYRQVKGQPLRNFKRGHNAKGVGNPMYRGVKTKPRYVQVYVPNHPFRDKQNKMMKHRLVMEQHIKRYLTSEEEVHHIDGNPENNDISNLKLCSTTKEHNQYHLIDMSGRICAICGSDRTSTGYPDNRPDWHYHENGWQCDICYMKEYNKKYYEKNKLKKLNYLREYSKNNYDRLSEQRKKRYYENHEYMLEYQRERRRKLKIKDKY